MLRDNGICVVESSDPSAVRFVEPMPELAQRTKIENAAIQLSRRIMNRQPPFLDGKYIDKESVWRTFTQIVINGTPLDAKPTEAELLKQEQRDAKRKEAQRLGREEARAARAAKKAEKGKQKWASK